jgi:phage gp36-like protein
VAYTTSAEIQAAVGGATALKALTSLTNTAIDSDAVTSAIEFASSVIDSYAIGTPGTEDGTAGALWSSTPIQAKHCAISLSVYRLYELIRREAPQTIKDAYARCMEMLKELAAGKTSWVATETPAVQNLGVVFYFGPGSTARDDNPRRTLRDSLDGL